MKQDCIWVRDYATMGKTTGSWGNVIKVRKENKSTFHRASLYITNSNLQLAFQDSLSNQWRVNFHSLSHSHKEASFQWQVKNKQLKTLSTLSAFSDCLCSHLTTWEAGTKHWQGWQILQMQQGSKESTKEVYNDRKPKVRETESDQPIR